MSQTRLTKIEQVCSVIDSKLEQIYLVNKIPAVIIINEHLYKQMQQELLEEELNQLYATMSSTFDLSSYKGTPLVTSRVVTLVEVF